MGLAGKVFRIVFLTLAATAAVTGNFFNAPTFSPQESTVHTNSLAAIAIDNLAKSSEDAGVLLEKAKRLYDAGKFREAILILENAVEMLQLQENHLQQAIALSNISLAYKQLGEYQRAFNVIATSRSLLEKQLNGQDSQVIINLFTKVIDIQASLFFLLGKYSLAAENWQQAAKIYQQVNLPNEKIRSDLNQGMALKMEGKLIKAEKILENVVTQIEPQPDSEIKAIALRCWGDLMLYLGDLNTASSALESAYGVAQRIESDSQIVEILLVLGNLEYLMGKRLNSRDSNTTKFEKTIALQYLKESVSTEAQNKYQTATNTYKEVIKLAERPEIKVKAQLNLLRIKVVQQDLIQVQQLYNQLKVNINQLPVSIQSVKTKINLAKTLLSLKQISPPGSWEWQEIQQIINSATKQATSLEDLRSQSYCMGMLGYISLQKGDLSSAQKLTEKAVNLSLAAQSQELAYLWQWQLGFIFKQQGDLNKAIDFYSRSVQNLNDLRGDLLVLNPDIQFSFRDNIEPVYRQLVDLLLDPEIPESQTQAKIKQARNTVETLQLREIENYFREACFQAKPEIIDTVVEKQGGNAAVIYPILLKNRIEVILKLPHQQKFDRYTYPIAADRVEDIIDELQASLREPDKINQIKELSAQVYTWLIKQLEPQLQASSVDTLVFTLDGHFRNIPMSILYNPNAPKHLQYLTQKYAIASTPGLQMLNPEPLKQQEINALIAGISEPQSFDNQDFDGIEYVQQELERIQEQVPNHRKLLNQSFTNIALEMHIDSGNYKIVHIATHANFSSNPEDTYILLWREKLKVREFDRLFQISKNLDNKAIQLLVLSACETATGDRRATLGLSGVAIRAGTRSTLATLWAVEDESTAEFMGQFYRELKNHQFNKAKALQAVQKQMIEKGMLPRNWAPYVLIGNWL